MKVRGVLAGALAVAVVLAGCGSGDPAVESTAGTLFVSSGGLGSIFFPRSQTSLFFQDSISVAVRTAQEQANNQFTVYTFFGLSRLNLREVPAAALVTFLASLNPNGSSATAVPSNTVGMMLHTGFNTGLVSNPGASQQILAQTAPVIYENTSSGTVVLEPQPDADGGFAGQNSPKRRLRFATVSLTDLDSGAEALINGSVNFQLSEGVSQEFYGYLGNLGLVQRPPVSGGGPPPPPGTGGVGGGGGGGGTVDNPPSPPSL